jgi:uncharacterized membrane protein
LTVARDSLRSFPSSTTGVVAVVVAVVAIVWTVVVFTP